MEKKYLELEEISAYKMAAAFSDELWKIISDWDWFNKSSLGIQFIKSVDSIAANIAEGFGRYHKKDKMKFYYNARGSVYESIHWCEKAFKRKLITTDEYNRIQQKLKQLPKEINTLIKLTNNLKI